MSAKSIDELNIITKNSTDIFIVAVGASWSGQYRIMNKTLTKIEGEGSTVCRIDIDKSRQLVEDLDCSMIPTLFIHYNGEFKAKKSGYIPIRELREMIENIKNDEGSW